ncbi:hypothetical protein NSTC745_03939 [Nostoc sp. DSM 114161]|jgi:hypothetical protein|uniref:hypothetical protein n=1 Tax=Nostoc sp. DSM 114161 TaxID=3440143 RepID=UPI0040454649
MSVPLCKRKTKIAGNSVWLMLLMPNKYFPQDVPDYNAIAWLKKSKFPGFNNISNFYCYAKLISPQNLQPCL